MKKVLIFSLTYYPRFVGGAEVAIKEITNRISREEIEFHMVTLRLDSTLPRIETIGNVTIHRIGFSKKHPTFTELKQFPLSLNKPLYQFLAPWKAAQLHRALQFDAVWAMMAHSAGVPAVLFKFMHPEVPYVLNLQEGDPIPHIERKMRPLWPLFTRAFTRADVVQALSSYLADWARSRGFKGPIEIIPNAVNVKYFSHRYPVEEIDTIKKILGKKPEDVFLITTSRLVPKNAVDDVIRALPSLPRHVHFMVLGEGPELEPLKRFARTKGVADRVRFFGHIDHEVMPRYLQASDIFIRPSRSEGFGASFSEAMAAGIPIIATQEGGLADFLFDEKHNPDKVPTGWVVDRDAPEQIVKAVEDIIAHPEKVAQVTQNAKKLVTEKYDWDIIARDMQERVFSKLWGYTGRQQQ